MISCTLLARRYAKALLQTAEEEGVASRAFLEARALAAAIGEDPEIQRFLSKPLVAPSDKLGVLLSSFPARPSQVLSHFLKTVMENRRERFLPQILREFLQLFRAARGELKVALTTAFRLSSARTRLLQRELSAKLRRKVELVPMVDRLILGGASLQVEDTLYDATLRTRVRRLEASLRSEPVSLLPTAKGRQSRQRR